ncbi:MAG: hypothetical protein H8D78_20445 [Chloroflexi bacterium]|nr:hypothetical protein [Chloroflexota bacterium]
MAEETTTQDVVYSLAASPTFDRDGLCFAARASGLYRSEDGGLTWQDAYASLELDTALPTAAVAVSPDFQADGCVFAGVPGAILRSLDGGRSWFVTRLPSPPPLVLALVVSPNWAHDGTLLAGTLEDGVFRSGDRGALWPTWNFGLLDLNVLCLAISPDFAHDETLFAGTESGIFRSTNGGRAWREVDFSPDAAPVLTLALSPNYANNGVLFAGTESQGLFRSDDRGHHWVRLGESIVTDAVNGLILSPQFPAQPHMLVVQGDALLVSRDGGHTWSPWQAGWSAGRDIASVIAPQGLDPGAPLLVGLVGGDVLRI